MKKVSLSLFLISALSVLLLGQTGPSVKQTFKPGDRLHYYITFQSEIKAPVGGVRILFSLETEPPKDQLGLPSSWWGAEFHQISSNVFEVDGTIDNVMSGSYRLNQIRLGLQGGGERIYNYPADFRDDISIRVVNDRHDLFPDIRSVSPNPPRP